MCKSFLVLAASLALYVGFANPAFAQQGRVNPADSKRLAGMRQPNPTPPVKTEPEKKSDEPLSPARQAAKERLEQAWKQFKMVDDVIEVHERRIRMVRSIRVPAGVRPPQIDPVPQQLLQLRAQAWNVLQEARRTFEQTR